MKRLGNGRVRHFDTSDPVPATATATTAPLTEARISELIGSAFKTFSEKTLKSQFDGLTSQFTQLHDSVKPLLDASTTPTTGTTPKAGELPAEVNALIKSLQREVGVLKTSHETESTARKAAETRSLEVDKESKIKDALKGYAFVNDDAYQTAFDSIAKLVKRDGEGNLISEADNLPLSDFVTGYVPGKKAYLLKPENRSGSGATTGSPRVNGREVGIEDIKAGASNEVFSAVASQIRRHLANAS